MNFNDSLLDQTQHKRSAENTRVPAHEVIDTNEVYFPPPAAPESPGVKKKWIVLILNDRLNRPTLDNDASVRERREIASRVVFKPREKSVTARVSIDGQEFENISFFQVQFSK